MKAVRVEKAKWSREMSDWLTAQLETGKYVLIPKTLEPNYEYFEYLFVNSEDATAFSLTFSNTIYEYRIYRHPEGNDSTSKGTIRS